MHLHGGQNGLSSAERNHTMNAAILYSLLSERIVAVETAHTDGHRRMAVGIYAGVQPDAPANAMTAAEKVGEGMYGFAVPPCWELDCRRGDVCDPVLPAHRGSRAEMDGGGAEHAASPGTQ